MSKITVKMLDEAMYSLHRAGIDRNTSRVMSLQKELEDGTISGKDVFYKHDKLLAYYSALHSVLIRLRSYADRDGAVDSEQFYRSVVALDNFRSLEKHPDADKEVVEKIGDLIKISKRESQTAIDEKWLEDKYSKHLSLYETRLIDTGYGWRSEPVDILKGVAQCSPSALFRILELAPADVGVEFLPYRNDEEVDMNFIHIVNKTSKEDKMFNYIFGDDTLTSKEARSDDWVLTDKLASALLTAMATTEIVKDMYIS